MSIDFELDLKYKHVCRSIDLAEDVVQFRAVLRVAIKYQDPQKA